MHGATKQRHGSKRKLANKQFSVILPCLLSNSSTFQSFPDNRPSLTTSAVCEWRKGSMGLCAVCPLLHYGSCEI